MTSKQPAFTASEGKSSPWDSIHGPAAPLAELPFSLTPEIATTPSAARLQRPLNFGKDSQS